MGMLDTMTMYVDMLRRSWYYSDFTIAYVMSKELLPSPTPRLVSTTTQSPQIHPSSFGVLLNAK